MIEFSSSIDLAGVAASIDAVRKRQCEDCISNAACNAGMAGCASCALLENALFGLIPPDWSADGKGGWSCAAHEPDWAELPAAASAASFSWPSGRA